MPEVSMDYDAVDDLAEQVDAAAESLAQGRSAVVTAPATYHTVSEQDSRLDINAFGNTPAAGRLSALQGAVRRAGRTAAERLGAVLVEDAGRLREVIACFQRTDHASADQLCAAVGGHTLPVYSTHVHSTGSRGVAPDQPVNPHDVWPPPDPTDPIWDDYDPYHPPTPPVVVGDGTANDYVRGGQIDTFRELFEQNPGVAGADLNVEAGSENRGGEAVRAFEDGGHDIHAGRLDDGEGGTSLGGYHIDYVVTAPGIASGTPERVKSSSSDHDGQRVDLTISRW